MKKLLFVIPNLNAGGAERVLINVANLLSDEFIVYIIVLRNKGINKKFLNKNIEIIVMNKSRLMSSALNIIFKINKLKPDYIFSSLLHINIYLIILKVLLFKKITLIIRESNFHWRNSTSSILNIIVFKYLYKNINFLISSSEEMKKDFLKKFNINPNKVFYIPNPVKFYNKISYTKYRNYIHPKKINFLAVGRLVDQKNFSFLIKFFSTIDKNKYTLNIIGEGPDYLKLKKLISEHRLQNNIYIKKNINDLENMYNLMDVLIMPSKWEGMPNVVLEALFIGMTVIVSRESGAVLELKKNFEKKLKIYYSKSELYKIINSLNIDLIKKNKTVSIPKEFKLNVIKKKYADLID